MQQSDTQSTLILSSSDGDRCDRCTKYRSTLNKAASRKDTAKALHSHTNHRYLTSSEKVVRLQELQQKNRLAQKRITRLTEKLAEISAKDVCHT